MLEPQTIQTKLKLLDRKLKIGLTSIISGVRTHNTLAVLSFNNDVIMAVDYFTSTLDLKLNEQKNFECVRITHIGICSD